MATTAMPDHAVVEDVALGTRVGPLAFSGDTIEIGRKIGDGATANVYECRRLSGNEKFPLAVKVIDTRKLALMDEGDKPMQRLEAEVQALREANHEKCLGLQDIFRSRRHIFLVMEKLTGGELFDQISRKKQFNEVEARYVFRQVCEGVAFLHSKRIVHRDIKPENVLIAGWKDASPPDEGTLYDVKIADYGLSKILNEGSTARSMVGTPQYWAPEVVCTGQTSRAYDERADLWSLGVFLYVMLRGRYPFKSGNVTEPDMTGGIWSEISEEAKDLIRGLLKAEPEERLTLHAVLLHPWVTGRKLEKEPSVHSPMPMPSSPPSALTPPSPATSRTATNTSTEAAGTQSQTGSANQAKPGKTGASVTVPFTVHSLTGQSTLARCNEQGNHQQGRVQVGKGEHDDGATFDLRELAELQVSLVASLEMAALACRHAHPALAAEIQAAIVSTHQLGIKAARVVKEYGVTAQAVKERVLPELELAVDTGVSEMALDCLDLVSRWAQDMRKESEETQNDCIDFTHKLQGIITKAVEAQMTQGQGNGNGSQNSRMIFDVDTEEALPTGMNRKTQDLFTGLASFAKRAKDAEGTDGKNADTICEEPFAGLADTGLIDLLFLAPGVKRSSSAGTAKSAATSDLTDDTTRSPPDTEESDTAMEQQQQQQQQQQPEHGQQQQQGQVMQLSSFSSNNPFTNIADPLLRALQELRRVSTILRECMSFWTNMDGTVKELSMLRDNMQTLVKYTSANPKIKERFDQRLGEYYKFWDSLIRLCQQYCMEVEPALARAMKTTESVELMADRIDARA